MLKQGDRWALFMASNMSDGWSVAESAERADAAEVEYRRRFRRDEPHLPWRNGRVAWSPDNRDFWPDGKPPT